MVRNREKINPKKQVREAEAKTPKAGLIAAIIKTPFLKLEIFRFKK
ncbi:unnamed protein product, partial [marine sediment metagenome]